MFPLAEFAREEHAALVAQIELQFTQQGHLIHPAQVAAAGAQVSDVPVPIRDQAYQSSTHAVRQGSADGAASHDLIIIGKAELDAGLELVCRRPSDHIDRAAGGVTAEQRALRASEHLDALDICQVDNEFAGAGQRDAIHHERHARLNAAGEGI